LPVDEFVDEWGTRWTKRPDTEYYEVFDPPLRHATIEDLDRYPWPDLAHPSRFAGLAAEARRLHDETPYAIVGMSGVAPWEMAYVMRGLDAILADLIADPELVQSLLEKISVCMLNGVQRFLQECGQYIDVLITGDDLGMQFAPMMSPRLYRKLIKPHHERLLGAIKRMTKAKIFFHSDGNIYPLIGDLIDVGVDLLNPVQVSAGDMADTAQLKREFGAHLAFCGGIDTQWALPFGRPEDVRREVRRRMQDLGPGGGYIVASVHCIQPDVSPQNVIAMCDEVTAHGHYPLKLRSE
jgi:uroporphyrinogen decarboxylase